MECFRAPPFEIDFFSFTSNYPRVSPKCFLDVTAFGIFKNHSGGKFGNGPELPRLYLNCPTVVKIAPPTIYLYLSNKAKKNNENEIINEWNV